MSFRLAFAVVFAVGFAGCRSSSGDADLAHVVPSTEQARSALTSALAAWKDGHPGGAIASASPKVEVIDSFRKSDRPLKDFEILGPIEFDRFRCFAVRLSIDNPAEVEVVRFLVIGNDPIWVFRQEDVERISHWEHKMEETEPADAPSPSVGTQPVPGG
jgi:hypothetical protein